MVIETDRFGSVEIEEDRILSFAAGIPGFEELHKFVIINSDATEPIQWMQSIEDRAVVLPVIHPFTVLKDYSLEIDNEALAEIGVTKQEQLLILNVIVIPEDITKMTANLIAPILINIENGNSRQVVVDSKEYSVRYPIFEKLLKVIEGGSEDAGALPQDR